MKSKSRTIILGVNGWYHDSHNASIALIEVVYDRVNVLVALEEERVTRSKYSFDTLPTESLKEGLLYTGLDYADINHIVYGWDIYAICPNFTSEKEQQLIKDLFCNQHNNGSLPSITYLPHHKAHAASVALTSEVSRSIIVVIDGQGEDCSTSAWLYEDKKLRELTKSTISASLCYMYDAISTYIGFTELDAGKTMGLAAYGEPKFANSILQLFRVVDGEVIIHPSLEKLAADLSKGGYDLQIPIIRIWRLIIKKITGFNPNREKVHDFRNIDKKYADLAASAQKAIETITNELIKYFTIKYNCKDVCLSGGLALNCKSNGEQLSTLQLSSLYVQPAAGDAGVSLGAALNYCSDVFGLEPPKKPFSPFIGISYTNGQILNTLKKYPQIIYTIDEDAKSTVASLIADSCIIGLFSGRCEWGPRALGNRSIICRADDRNNIEHINSFVKHRELGRPLGPSMADVAAAEELGRISEKSYYMTTAHRINNTKSIQTSHVDHTIRPQVVTDEMNPEYYALLLELRNKYSIQAVINTSFNDRTPIVHRPEEAIELLLNNQLNAICFNNCIVVTKPDNELNRTHKC